MRYSKLDLEMKRRSEEMDKIVSRPTFSRFPRNTKVKDLPKMGAYKRSGKNEH